MFDQRVLTVWLLTSTLGPGQTRNVFDRMFHGWPSNFITHDQTWLSTIKHDQTAPTRCPNGKMSAHQTMFDGVWSPSISYLWFSYLSVIPKGKLSLLKPNEISPYTNRNNHEMNCRVDSKWNESSLMTRVEWITDPSLYNIAVFYSKSLATRLRVDPSLRQLDSMRVYWTTLSGCQGVTPLLSCGKTGSWS